VGEILLIKSTTSGAAKSISLSGGESLNAEALLESGG
jgi:hypothetical protein